MNRYGYSSIAEGGLRKFSDIGAWYAIEDCTQYDKKYSNPTSAIPDETIANLNAQIVRDDMVKVQVPRCMAWLNYDEHVDSLSTMDNKVRVTSPESTIQTLPSFEEYAPPVTYPKEKEETIGTSIEVEPLDETQLEDLGLNTCNHDIPLSNRKVPSFDEPKPQRNPLPNCPSLYSLAGCEFLKKSEHLCHYVVDLFSLFKDSVFKPLHSFAKEFCLGGSPGPCGRGFEETALAYACGTCVEITLALVVVESKVQNDLPRFIGVLVMKLTVDGVINLAFKVKGDMIIKKLDLKPTIDAMMRDFLD
uniref:Uncharacterized protein n=1 Tax=Tanacetum cinerariifolium TaxID=118510 RepID=A0A699GRH7_TANCI|nr:hypothetical protein [Tanacetum cinerariifolium]